MGLRVRTSKNVVGCRIGNEIYVHPELKGSPELYRAILSHEKEHTGGFSLSDFMMDLSNQELKGLKRQYYSFILRHPRTLISFFPISKVGKHLTFDAGIAFLWLFFIIVASVTLFVAL